MLVAYGEYWLCEHCYRQILITVGFMNMVESGKDSENPLRIL